MSLPHHFSHGAHMPPGEDKLNQIERLRLEAVAQSLNYTSLTSENRPTMDDLLKNAKRIAHFIATGQLTEPN